MTVSVSCVSARPDRSAEPLFSRAHECGGLFHPFRRFPSDGQDQEPPGLPVSGPRLILEQAGLNIPAPSSRAAPGEALKGPGSIHEQTLNLPRARPCAAPLGSVLVACLGRYQEPSPATGTAMIMRAV